jgi:hypothetical protein
MSRDQVLGLVVVALIIILLALIKYKFSLF